VPVDPELDLAALDVVDGLGDVIFLSIHNNSNAEKLCFNFKLHCQIMISMLCAFHFFLSFCCEPFHFTGKMLVFCLKTFAPSYLPFRR
jgi:hypothetical protein